MDTPLRWRRVRSALWRATPRYLVVALPDGSSLEIGGPGADVWRHLDDWMTRDELIVALSDVYDVDTATTSADLDELLRQLHEGGYVVCTH